MDSEPSNVVTATSPPQQGWLAANISYIIAVMVVTLGFAYLFTAIWVPGAKDSAAVIALLSAVVYFWYGSSVGSRDKDKARDQQVLSLNKQVLGLIGKGDCK